MQTPLAEAGAQHMAMSRCRGRRLALLRAHRGLSDLRLLLLRVLGCLPLKDDATHSGGKRLRSLKGGNRGTGSLGGAADYGESGVDPCGVVGIDNGVRTA
jgi:hypothetical protein